MSHVDNLAFLPLSATLPPGHLLLTLPNCHITPHVGGGHQGEPETIVGHFLENFRRYVDEAPLLDRIM